MFFHIGHIWMVCRLCVCACVSQCGTTNKTLCHKSCKGKPAWSFLYGPLVEFEECFPAQIMSVLGYLLVVADGNQLKITNTRQLIFPVIINILIFLKYGTKLYDYYFNKRLIFFIDWMQWSAPHGTNLLIVTQFKFLTKKGSNSGINTIHFFSCQYPVRLLCYTLSQISIQ